ncbi:hypothetical protein CPB86DRAFT_817449 [Serendipita vermifera]|nr:hypothetical protein CPB86DRAFT_817449 [Serendipita vermifera]
MATHWQHTSVSPEDVDLNSRNNQLEPIQSVDPLEDRQDKSQFSQRDNLKLDEDDSQTFTNAGVSDILEIPSWPGPQTLEVTDGENLLRKIGYIFLLVPPLLFLALVLSAMGLDSNQKNPFGGFVGQACNLGPTAFPIVFSAILGSCLKTYGIYRSERGVKLGELERVIGSQTLFLFLKLAFKFRQLDRLCIILGILWVLSPLGGQGILRMLSMREVTNISSDIFFYTDLYGSSDYSSNFETERSRGRINGLYVASLLAPVAIKNSTTDIWGAIKIPQLSFSTLIIKATTE